MIIYNKTMNKYYIMIILLKECYYSTSAYNLLISNSTFLTKVITNPNLLLFLHKNPDLLEECFNNPTFFNILLSQSYITSVTTNLYNILFQFIIIINIIQEILQYTCIIF